MKEGKTVNNNNYFNSKTQTFKSCEKNQKKMRCKYGSLPINLEKLFKMFYNEIKQNKMVNNLFMTKEIIYIEFVNITISL